MSTSRSGLALCGLAALLASTALAQAQEVNIYTARHYDSDYTLYEMFTEATGIRVNVIEGEADALIERLVAEGANSPGDVFITVDAGRLWRAEEAGLFQPVSSAVLEERIPAHLRDPEGMWFAFAKRARIFYFNTAAGAPEGLETYADLADFDGTICMRTSSNIYNQSLLAAMIAVEGEEAAEAWAAGVVEHFARPPEGNDRAQIQGVAAGLCDVGVANSYYWGQMLTGANEGERRAAESVTLFFPNQEAGGTHVNISGAGVLANAPNFDAAVAFLEFMVSDEAQALYASASNEFPAVPGITADNPLAPYADFVEAEVNAEALGTYNPVALRIFDRVGWN